MEGYDVVTIDDEKVGKVAGESGDYLLVEHGALRKSTHALPRQFAHVDDSERQVRMTVAKEVFGDSPKVENELDEQAVARHYGLIENAGHSTGFPEEQEQREGIAPAPEERARIREGKESGIQESPALLGDRVAGVENDEPRR
jgi:hypothetical protein